MSNNNTCYGILLDVSGSMQKALTDDVKLSDENKNRAHAVFDTIFETIKEERDNNNNNNDNIPNDKFFALAFGLKSAEKQHCDLFGLFENLLSCYETKQNWMQILNSYGIHNNTEQYIHTERKYNIKRCKIIGYEPLIEMAKHNGAPYAGEYIVKHLIEQEAGEIFMHFHHRQDLIGVTVDELPAACKLVTAHIGLGGLAYGAELIGVGEETLRNAEDESAKEALKKAKKRILAPIYNMVREVRSRRDAINIIDKLSEAYPLGSSQNNMQVDVDELLTDIKGKIFGLTPMCKSLNYSQQIFELSSQNNGAKRLLIISDGLATDGNPIVISSSLKEKNVIIGCCLITKKNISNPTQLYDTVNSNWSKGAQTMFEMASFMNNTDSSMSILLKYGWDLAQSGESKLFVQANHPDVITQFCGIINHVAEHSDAIMDMVGCYNFDKYINNKLSDTEAPHQVGSTCYANAAAMGIHLAMSRIYERDGGYPDFEVLRKAMIDKYGTKGKNTELVIKDFCKQNRLHYEERKGEENIRRVICRRRPLVATFRLSKEGWYNFSAFFENNRNGILTRDDITRMSGRKYFRFLNNNVKIYDDIQCVEESKQQFKKEHVLYGIYCSNNKIVRLPKQYGNNKNVYCKATDIEEIDGHEYDGGGHAVILIRIESDCLVFMNSWGKQWGDNGFFRIQNIDVLEFKNYKMAFYDIYWTLNDLSANEKKKYEEYTKQKAKEVMNNVVPSTVYGLKYECPECNQLSKIKEYSGDFMEAICPKCNANFKPNGIGLIRSLYDRQLSHTQ